MGLFDTVLVNCPKCGKENEFQSKGGDCSLNVYTLEDCPGDVLSDVNRHSPHTCDCGELFSVDVFSRKIVKNKYNPPVKVKRFHPETGEIEYGEVIDSTLHTYLVLPDDNPKTVVMWEAKDSEILY